MVDRAPTKPNRYAVYDENHNFLRYEYHERADEPTQVGDALNKANLLPDDVATALGLTGNPQVRDALEAINSGFVDTRKCWWEKYAATYDESLAAPTQLTLAEHIMAVQAVIDAASTISFGESGNPILGSTTNIEYGSQLSALNNKYIELSGVVYKCVGDVTFVTHDAVTKSYYINASVVSGVLTKKGDYIDSVYSYENDTYPVDGVQDGYYYTYISKTSKLPAQIATGSYKGTGTYGSGNPNSLTFGFEPKFVIVEGYGNSIEGEKIIMIAGRKKTTVIPRDTYSAIDFTINSNTVSWYNGTAAHYQLNRDGRIYNYVAIG